MNDKDEPLRFWKPKDGEPVTIRFISEPNEPFDFYCPPKMGDDQAEQLYKLIMNSMNYDPFAGQSDLIIDLQEGSDGVWRMPL